MTAKTLKWMEGEWEKIDEIIVKKMPPLFSDERRAYDKALRSQYEAGLREYGERQKQSPVKYVPKAGPPKYTWIDDLIPPLAKLAGGLTAIGGGVYLAISGLAAAKAALQALILSNPLTSLAVIVCAGVFAFRKKSGNSANPKNEPGSGEWEFYQEQKQGFRKKQP